MPHNRRNYNKTHSIALSGLLFALAMALSFIEGTLVIPGLLPGMKLGLANIAYLVHPVGLRRAGPQHRPAAGSQCHPFHSSVPLLCTGHAGAGSCDGNAHQCHPAGHTACAGTAGL